MMVVEKKEIPAEAGAHILVEGAMECETDVLVKPKIPQRFITTMHSAPCSPRNKWIIEFCC